MKAAEIIITVTIDLIKPDDLCKVDKIKTSRKIRTDKINFH